MSALNLLFLIIIAVKYTQRYCLNQVAVIRASNFNCGSTPSAHSAGVKALSDNRQPIKIIIVSSICSELPDAVVWEALERGVIGRRVVDFALIRGNYKTH